MSRKSVLLGIAILLALLAVVTTTLALLARHEPERYGRLRLPPGPERTDHSKQFVTEFFKVINGIKNSDAWDVEFTEAQINSYLDEDFITSNVKDTVCPDGTSEPRVALDDGKMRLFFRYGKEPWQTVISLQIRAWLPKQEPNVIALEIQGLRAGALPIISQSLLEHVCKAARKNEIDVTWYRHEGNPVALLRFQSGPRPTVQLQRLELHQGKLRIGGCPRDDSRAQAVDRSQESGVRSQGFGAEVPRIRLPFSSSLGMTPGR